VHYGMNSGPDRHMATSEDYPPVQCQRGGINGSRTRAGT